jgi:predicted outer membrane repeat protein
VSILHPRARRRTFTASLLVLGLAAAGVVAFPLSASAATFTVTSNADSGAGSLRAAIVAANGSSGPDTITFTLPANSAIELLSAVSITEGLTIDGSGTPGLDITGIGGLGAYLLFLVAPGVPDQDFSFHDLIFDGTAGSVSGWQGVAIATTIGVPSNVPRSVALTRITGKNILSPFQGPVLNVFSTQSGGSVTITDSTFTNNTSTVGSLNGGGAIFIRGTDGLVTVTGSTFTGNTARSGGAIFFDGNGGGVATLSVVSSAFTGNTANGTASVPASDGEGGAIAASLIGNVTITGSTFSGNTASLDGGAIAIGALVLTTTQVSIATSSFLSNHAKFGGGGFWSSTTQGDVSISGSTFAGNTLSTTPGDSPLGNSIRLTGTGNHGLSVLSSTLDEAAAAFSTWAIAIETTGTSPLTIAHSTIVGPGAVTVRTLIGTSSAVSHTILSSLGTADDALVVLVPGLPGVNTIATSWSLSSGTAASYLAVGAGNHFSVANFGLATLANNGGTTQTRLPADSSPAHNAGNPAIVGAPATDQRGAGFARIVQTIDIGAVEIQPAVPAAVGSSPALAATGFVLNPWVPVTGVLLLLLGVGAVLYTRRRREGSRRA